MARQKLSAYSSVGTIATSDNGAPSAPSAQAIAVTDPITATDRSESSHVARDKTAGAEPTAEPSATSDSAMIEDQVPGIFADLTAWFASTVDVSIVNEFQRWSGTVAKDYASTSATILVSNDPSDADTIAAQSLPRVVVTPEWMTRSMIATAIQPLGPYLLTPLDYEPGLLETVVTHSIEFDGMVRAMKEQQALAKDEARTAGARKRKADTTRKSKRMTARMSPLDTEDTADGSDTDSTVIAPKPAATVRVDENDKMKRRRRRPRKSLLTNTHSQSIAAQPREIESESESPSQAHPPSLSPTQQQHSARHLRSRTASPGLFSAHAVRDHPSRKPHALMPYNEPHPRHTPQIRVTVSHTLARADAVDPFDWFNPATVSRLRGIDATEDARRAGSATVTAVSTEDNDLAVVITDPEDEFSWRPTRGMLRRIAQTEAGVEGE